MWHFFCRICIRWYYFIEKCFCFINDVFSGRKSRTAFRSNSENTFKNKNFSKKKFYPPKCPSEQHVECSFDNPAESASLKVCKFFD